MRDSRLDYLRIAAIAAILLHHSDDYAIQFLRSTPLLTWLDDVVLTYVALAVLFAISGFLTARTMRNRSNGWREYVSRRFGRLYIPFVIALLAIKLLGVFVLDWRNLALNALLLGPWAGKSVGTLWFVEILLYYQVLYAVITSANDARQPWLASALVAAATLVLVALLRVFGLVPDPRLLLYAGAFLCGAGAAGAEEERPNASRAGSCALALLLASLGLLGTEPWPLQAFVTIAVTAVLLCLLLSSAATAHRPGGRLSAVFERLAYGSMMAYLIHRIVYFFTAKLVMPLGEVWVGPALLATVPLILLAGIVLQQAYDRLRAD